MFSDKEINPSLCSPLALAFIGDTVYDMIIREELIIEANRPVKDLHKMASGKVCASAQSEAIKKLIPLLTEEENEVFRRGRNAHPGSLPKNQSPADYHYATGFECLLGWLYLGKKEDRIKELCSELSGADEEPASAE